MQINHFKARIFFAALLFGLNLSCEDDIEDNRGAFQAHVQGNFWKAAQATASILDDGTLIIVGLDAEQRMVLQATDFNPGVYTFSSSVRNRGAFETFSGTVSAATRPFQSTGAIRVTTLNSRRATVTGNFQFIGIDNFTGEQFFVCEGLFYEIPIVSFNPDLLNPIDPDPPGDDGGGDDNPDDPGPFQNHFFARVNGNPFPSQSISTSVANGQICITNAVPPNMQPAMTICFAENVSPGVLTLGINGTSAAFYTPGGVDLNADAGNIIIDSHDTSGRKVSGRFSFNINQQGNPIEVTQGEFSVRY